MTNSPGHDPKNHKTDRENSLIPAQADFLVQASGLTCELARLAFASALHSGLICWPVFALNPPLWVAVLQSQNRNNGRKAEKTGTQGRVSPE